MGEVRIDRAYVAYALLPIEYYLRNIEADAETSIA
jgi:hypothetical protein